MKKLSNWELLAGGEGGIRTHGTVAGTPHFECGAFDLSATSPQDQETLAGLWPGRSGAASSSVLAGCKGRCSHFPRVGRASMRQFATIEGRAADN